VRQHASFLSRRRQVCIIQSAPVQRLTYEPDSPFGLMHGFLNLFLAAAYLSHGMEKQEAVELLEETSNKDIHFDEMGVTWHGQS
jgi:hypothetical protein